jgi:DNA-binding NtrC family response regulator
MAGSPILQSDPGRIATALLISPFEQDHVFFLSLFSRTNWRLLQANSREEAFQLMTRQEVPVVVAEEQLGLADWKDILGATEQMRHPPKLVVASALSDGNLWAEVLNRGGYDVLARPFDQREVLHCISTAWLAWKQEAEKREGQDYAPARLQDTHTHGAAAGGKP